MKKALSLISLLLVIVMTALPLASCKSGLGVPAGAKDLLADVSRKIDSGLETDNEFRSAMSRVSFTLTEKLYVDGKNFLVSPLSIILALSLAENGASGQTLAQFEAMYGIPVLSLNAYLRGYTDALPRNEKNHLDITNSLWLRDDARMHVTPTAEYLQAVKDYYEADLFSRAFDDEAVKAINAWVKKNTDGMIDKIIDKLGPDTAAVLINALYFEAKWAQPFDYRNNYDGMFHNADGSSSTVTYMSGDGHDTYVATSYASGFLKYYENGYAFMALLPKDGQTVADVLSGLTDNGLTNAINSRQGGKTFVTVPKFSYDYETGDGAVIDTLISMGVKDAFDKDNANFGGLKTNTNERLYISKIIHKTRIELGEEGTRAAAVTAVIMDTATAMPEQPHYVTLDRPFVYVIYDTAGQVPIFVGVVNTMK